MPRLRPKEARRATAFRVAAGVVGAELAAAGAELGGFGFDDREVVVFGKVHVAAGDGLAELAVADDVGRAADEAAGERALERAGEVEGVGEEEVAQEDAGFVVPAGVDGIDVAADGGFVEDVVVDERGGVDHFDDRGERDVVVAECADRLAGQQQQGRAEAFAGQPNAVANDGVGLGVVAVELFLEAGVDAAELGLDAGVEGGERGAEVEVAGSAAVAAGSMRR